MINEEKLEREYLEKQNKIAEEMFNKSIKNIYEDFKKNQKEISRELTEELEKLREKFEERKEKTIVKELKYVNFSYMRTSISDKYPIYRIDMYDENWMITDVECYTKWKAEFVYKYLYEIEEVLRNNFQKQARVKMYKAEEIITEKAEEYNKIAMSILMIILVDYYKNKDIIEFYRNNKVKISIGEYMDESITIIDWGEEKWSIS